MTAPLACSLTSSELRRRRDEVLKVMRSAQAEQVSLVNGYRLEFTTSGELLSDLAAFIDAERQCCTFLTFRLTVSPETRRTSLELTGPVGTREFLEAELGFGIAPNS